MAGCCFIRKLLKQQDYQSTGWTRTGRDGLVLEDLFLGVRALSGGSVLLWMQLSFIRLVHAAT